MQIMGYYNYSVYPQFAMIGRVIWNSKWQPNGNGTISNTRATFAYHSFCDNLRLQCNEMSDTPMLLVVAKWCNSDSDC